MHYLYKNPCSEVEVKSISLIISRTHFSTAFSLYLEIKNYYILFQKPSYKNYLSFFFNNLENQTMFILFLLKSKGSIPCFTINYNTIPKDTKVMMGQAE